MIPVRGPSVRRDGSAMARLHRGVGDILLLLDCPRVAARAYADALRGDPLYADAHLGRGDALGRAGLWAEASASYRAAVRLQPSSLEACGSLIRALARARRPSDCLAAIEGLIRLRPFDAEPHLLRGALLGRLGRHTQAVQAFRWAAPLEVGRTGKRFLLAEDILGAPTWSALLEKHRSARALVRPKRTAATTEGRSVLNGPPERPKTTPARSKRPVAKSRRSRLRAVARVSRACLSSATSALLASARATWRGFWMGLAAALRRRRPHLALRSVRTALAFPLDERKA
jgi:tetratricopeptide (TPR) repeat protein